MKPLEIHRNPLRDTRGNRTPDHPASIQNEFPLFDLPTGGKLKYPHRTMLDVIKKTLLAGLGATVVTAERVEKSLSELVEKGKLSADEARKTAQKVVEEGRQEWEQSRTELAKTFEDLLKKAKLARQEDLKALEARIAALEAAAAKPATKPKKSED